ncbi:O-antigen ligase family protein [Pseudomonas cedrina subsp. fulgida]|nr:O-antigen ligase family protein [Pseudomonas cedrina subsp. fulgida]
MLKLNFIPIGAALVVFGSVATALRFGDLPFGVSEVAVALLFLWSLRYHQALHHLTHPIILFWIGFIAITAVAALVSPMKGGGSMHTAVAYLYAACFSLMALACASQATSLSFKCFIKYLVVVPIVLLTLPFVLYVTKSRELAEMLGVNYFPARLSGWSINPNQLAMFLLPLPILWVAVNHDAQWKGLRLLGNLLLLWVIFLLGINVRSDALLIAWCVGLLALTLAAARWQRPFNWKMFATLIAAFVLVIAPFKLMPDDPAKEYLFSNAQSDSPLGVGFDKNKTGVRKTLRDNAIEAWSQSPFIGNGPGAYSYLDNPEVKQEAHNLALDILTQAGIAGAVLFGALYLWLIVNAYKARDPYSLVILTILMIFSGAHFMLRQPSFSLYMIICAIAVRNGSFTTAREKSQSI